MSLRAFRDAQRAARELTGPRQATYAGVPKRGLLAVLIGLVRSQGPHHDPTHENIPPFAARWFDRYAQEPKSAARWYSVGARQ